MAKTEKEKALEIAKIMEDGKGIDVKVLDVSQLNSWTDYFVIVTVTSSAHWQGLYRQVTPPDSPDRRSSTGTLQTPGT